MQVDESSVGRYYDPATGQFLSVDPMVGVTGQPYAYTGDDPVNGVDPLGLIGAGLACSQFGSQSSQCTAAQQVSAQVTSSETAGQAGANEPIIDIAGPIVNYVVHHPLQTVGLVVGVIAIATGVGALAGGVIIGDVTISAGTLGAASFVAGSTGAALDGPACLDGHDATACVGFGLNAGSALLGGDALLIDRFTEEGESTALSTLYKALGLGFGSGGFVADLASYLGLIGSDQQSATCQQVFYGSAR